MSDQTYWGTISRAVRLSQNDQLRFRFGVHILYLQPNTSREDTRRCFQETEDALETETAITTTETTIVISFTHQSCPIW